MNVEKALQTSGQAQAALQEIVDVDLPSLHSRPSELSTLPPVSEHRRGRSLSDHAFEVGALVNEVSIASQEDSPQADTVLYLAYGSNLCAETFRGKRGIRPLAELNVVVPELRLTFDLPGLPYVEPCFANVDYRTPPPEREEGRADEPLLQHDRPARFHKDRWTKGLVGVVYEVTMKDYAHIIATEGGGMAYQDVLVTCFPLPNGDTVPEHPDTPAFKAHTLFAPSSSFPGSKGVAKADLPRQRPVRGYAQASARYLKLITDGAREHRLPAEYDAYLHELRPYTITQQRQRIGRLVFVLMWGPALVSVFQGEKLFADRSGRSPKWFAVYVGAVFSAVWASYDAFFKKLFGDGERTIGQDDYDESVTTNGSAHGKLSSLASKEYQTL
ncbi:MAG: hypothetical protein M1826_006274 [Phylliscum demangeonii]|nr:MAG: hypothetical protein M1826_006274 [Phylliscum demangeonii]